MVLALVRNVGGRALDMNGTLRLGSGPGGLSAGPFPATVGTTVGIGQTEPVAILLDKTLPAGPWNAQIVLRSGLVERQANASLTFAGAPASPSTPTWLYPGLAILVALLAVLALFLAPRRRRQRTIALA